MMLPVLRVTAVTEEGLESTEESHGYTLGTRRTVLLWRDVASIAESDLAAEFPPYAISGLGSLILCYSGRLLFATDNPSDLAAQWLQWLTENPAAPALSFKASIS